VAHQESNVPARRIVDHRILGPPAPAPEIVFTFEGRAIQARTGEPIAAALLAAGERVFRTMPKTGEARGGYCFVGRCADCLVVVDGEPNVMACLTPICAGMTVVRQRGPGSWASGEGET
jgi:predicted molibdopterin-dependent oxidoreductase YjgC